MEANYFHLLKTKSLIALWLSYLESQALQRAVRAKCENSLHET